MMDRGLFREEKAVTVVFGALLLIVVIIAGVSGIAFMISEAQQNMMERQEKIDAVENENLKIVSIDPSVSSEDPLLWDAVNITVLNVDILDSKISAVSLNDKFSMNYALIDGRGNYVTHEGTNYPVIYNYQRKAEIPAGKSYQVHMEIPNFEICVKETIDLSDWRADHDLDNDKIVSLAYSPWGAYSDPECTVIVNDSERTYESPGDFVLNGDSIVIYNSGKMNLNVTEDLDLSSWPNATLNYSIHEDAYYDIKLWNASYPGGISKAGNWYVADHSSGLLHFNATGIVSPSCTDYKVNYTREDANFFVNYTTVFECFPESAEFRNDEPVTVEVISSLINIFKQRFMPPEPLAELQVKTERRLVNGSETWEDFLLLDASNSHDPDGFITSYRWEVTYNDTEKLYGFEAGDAELRGTKARPEGLDLDSAYNITIDLEVKDYTGMVSRLSDTSGKIVIYEK